MENVQMFSTRIRGIYQICVGSTFKNIAVQQTREGTQCWEFPIARNAFGGVTELLLDKVKEFKLPKNRYSFASVQGEKEFLRDLHAIGAI